MFKPTNCDTCGGLGFVIVDDWIDYGAGIHRFTFPDHCPAGCCNPRESEARFSAWEKERVV